MSDRKDGRSVDESETATRRDLEAQPNPRGSDDRVRVSVRYWAGAAAAAGVDAEVLHVPARARRCCASELRRAITGAHDGIDEVVRRCSLLLDGRRLDDDDDVTEDAVVEVLPPFAGG